MTEPCLYARNILLLILSGNILLGALLQGRMLVPFQPKVWIVLINSDACLIVSHSLV